MKQLPHGGAGYGVLEAQLEPSSKHFEFAAPGGRRFGKDGAKECLVIAPFPRLPFFTPCRNYPVWEVALSNQTCDVIVAINAYSGSVNEPARLAPIESS